MLMRTDSFRDFDQLAQRLLGTSPVGHMVAVGHDGEEPHLARASSTQLVQTLIEHGLVDELRLMVDPVLLGGGKRIFRDDGVLRDLELVDSAVTSTGAILASYAPAA